MLGKELVGTEGTGDGGSMRGGVALTLTGGAAAGAAAGACTGAVAGAGGTGGEEGALGGGGEGRETPRFAGGSVEETASLELAEGLLLALPRVPSSLARASIF